MKKWCEYGQIYADLPDNICDFGDEPSLVEHAEFPGPCPGCLRRWGELNGQRLILRVITDPEGVEECIARDMLSASTNATNL